jgi:DNA-binding phage protein
MAKRQPPGEVLATQFSDLGRNGRMFNDDEVLILLRAAVEREGNQVAFARHYGLQRASLNMILNGKRPVSEKVIKALGLRRVYAAPE